MKPSAAPGTVTEYIAAAAPATRPMLRQLRAAIRAAAPDARERISYRMPYYELHGRLAYFAAFAEHVSYFVMSSPAIEVRFGEQIAKYRTSKATLRFPIGSRLPIGLIQQLVAAKARENRASAKRGRSRAS